ncbi:MAG: hypothetical protein JXX28_01455 [Deltaproteobacteria bacterium]|nr:hypothetical protein [Deltaproteobacteria bacterium]
MRLFLAALLFLAAPALADEVMWATAPTPSIRFAEEAIPGPTFKEGERLTVIFHKGELLRVQGQAGLGWVAATALSAEDPTPAPVEGGFDLEAIKRSLQLTGDSLQGR